MLTITKLTRLAIPTLAMLALVAACETKEPARKDTSADAKAERLRDKADELDRKAAKIEARDDAREDRRESGPLDKLEERVEEDKEVREAAQEAREDVRDANR